MDLKKLGQQAKNLVDKRGGTESLKRDADELKGIAKGPGSFTDKAKAAVAAIKDPGADPEAQPNSAGPAAEVSPAETERAERKVRHDERGKHGHGAGRHGGGRGGRGGRNRPGGGDPAV